MKKNVRNDFWEHMAVTSKIFLRLVCQNLNWPRIIGLYCSQEHTVFTIWENWDSMKEKEINIELTAYFLTLSRNTKDSFASLNSWIFLCLWLKINVFWEFVRYPGKTSFCRKNSRLFSLRGICSCCWFSLTTKYLIGLTTSICIIWGKVFATILDWFWHKNI